MDHIFVYDSQSEQSKIVCPEMSVNVWLISKYLEN